MSNSSKTYKKLVIITSRFPYPLEKGDKLRAYYQIKELSKSFDIHLISITESTISLADYNELKRYCKEIKLYRINFLTKWLNVFFNLFSNLPFQVSYFYTKTIKRNIHRYLHHVQPDHIYCQLIRVAEYVKNYHNCPKTLDYMDALSKGIERRIESTSFWKKPAFRSEHKRLVEYESIIFDYFEHHVMISEQDSRHIFHRNKDAIQIIPNGVDQRFFIKNDSEKKYDLVFTGNMSYAPNIAASNFLVNDILPLLPHSNQLLLSGANPTREVEQLASNRVKVTGWVEDIRESYASGKIFAAPMFIGTGLQNKLLEAMAMGLPCITTPLANNALKAIPNESILIANNAEEFAKWIIQLNTDQALYEKLANNGRNFVKANYNWESTTKKLEKLFG